MDVIFAAAGQQPLLPQDVWAAWNWDPLLLVGSLLAAALYGRGVYRLWQRAGAGRALSYGHVTAFAAGLFVLAAALVSPLDAMSGALLSAHMVQHLLLMLVAAPLLVFGAPPVALGWMLPRSRDVARWWRRRSRLRRLWHTLSRPALVWGAYLLILWSWHLPGLYQAALADESVHILEHGSFVGIALLYWWVLWHDDSLGRAGSALYVFSTMLLSGLLGVLLTFGQQVWYPAYGILPYGWGLSPLQDQQLAGVIMWFPGNLIYLAATLYLLSSALHRHGQDEGRARVIVAPRQN
ncbi:MAG: cytochrome c oxidase assembly protein [Anaerolineae bacterium]|nr:cytochrome c oxidase assembly protein [Anaerolineae bacterium]